MNGTRGTKMRSSFSFQASRRGIGRRNKKW